MAKAPGQSDDGALVRQGVGRRANRSRVNEIAAGTLASGGGC